ncbi:phosphoglycerol transferase [Paenibacillus swuensis]|uniref:Phosphoglycerol transferase n=1 Tax=Paenibacillus swuensis TaxID=1178515 RepID=A0A172TMS1_9BACL|nr:LTA synthase family protein [Paenibacillus swuensis]ANE48320.1 phosphoglycerol transferase [Paenibacillus swuensis]
MSLHNEIVNRTVPLRESRIMRILYKINFIDYLFFIALLLWKIVLFDAFIAVPQVRMGVPDWLVGTGSILLLSGWVLILPMTWRVLVLLSLNILISVVIFSDLVYFRYFQDFISIPVLLQSKQVGELGGTIGTLVYAKDIFFFLDLIFLIPMALYGFKRLRESGSRQPERRFRLRVLRKFAANALVFTIGYALVFAPIHVAKGTWAKGLFTGNWWNVATYNVTGLLGFHGLDVYRYLDKNVLSKDEGLSEEQRGQINQWLQQHHELSLDGRTENTYGAYKGSNVIVVQVEALQNFMLNESIGGQEITPNLNKLMKESLYFSEFYHQTAQGRTSDADFSSNCSMHPLPSGSVFTQYANHTYHCLPNELQGQGYATGAFHGYEESFWNRYAFYPNIGYDRFYSKKDYNFDSKTEKVGWSIGDKPFFEQSVSHMTQMKQPFYSFLITLSSHHPFVLPKELQMLDVGELDGTDFGNYLQSVHYVDQSIGAFIESLKSQGMWDNTLFALYGDHDNSIKEKETLEQFTGRSLSELEWTKAVRQVPLIIHAPDAALKGTQTDIAGQLDLAPSLLHLLGVPPEGKFFMGQNVFKDTKERLVVFRNRSFTDGTVYYKASADQIFENGTCLDYASGQPTDIASCKPGYDETVKRLDISDQVITNNVLAETSAHTKTQTP